MPPVPDPQFAHPRLAPLYDVFDGERDDLTAHVLLLRQLGVRSVLDIGCGTGSFALLAAAQGADVTGVDPAGASVDVARSKAGAEAVTWCVGTVDAAPAGPYDLAVMTGNVAQVFLTDEEWLSTLEAVRVRLAPGGHLVFETRRPEARAWEAWAEPFTTRAVVSGTGVVEQSRELLAVDLPFVSFRWRFRFEDGATVHSGSTLRFRGREEQRRLLDEAGFELLEVRDAPDRPGLEDVYVAVVRGGAA